MSPIISCIRCETLPLTPPHLDNEHSIQFCGNSSCSSNNCTNTECQCTPTPQNEDYPNITSLPLELLVKIFSALPVKDIPAVSGTCSKFYQTATQNILWYELCRRDYKLCLRNHTHIFRAEEIYKNFLHPYGGLIGLSMRCSAPYGGLLKVELQNMTLTGWDTQPPVYPHIADRCTKTALFTVTYNSNSPAAVTCALSQHPHPAVVRRNRGGRYQIYCTEPHQHTQDEASRLYSNDLQHVLVEMRTDEMLKAHRNLSFEYEPIPGPPCYDTVSPCSAARSASAIIPPGCFSGDFGVNGFELAMLHYEDRWGIESVNVTKVMGDKYLGAGTLLIESNMKHSIDITTFILSHVRDRCSTIDNINRSLVCRTDFTKTFPYKQPGHFHCISEVPTSYVSAYAATINLRYTRGCPTKAIGVWVVFDSDTFGFLWMSNQRLVMFSRAKM